MPSQELIRLGLVWAGSDKLGWIRLDGLEVVGYGWITLEVLDVLAGIGLGWMVLDGIGLNVCVWAYVGLG